MASKSKPTDVTGRVREQMLEANAEELQARADEMSMASATAQAKLNDVIDATVPDRQTVIVDEPIEVGAATSGFVSNFTSTALATGAAAFTFSVATDWASSSVEVVT